MGSLENMGQKYFQEMGFNRYKFSPEDKKAICAYYEYWHTDNGDGVFIQPISKEDYNAMQYYREFLPDVCLLWHDGQGNYAGAYTSGILHGKVMFLSHGEPNYAPLFRSISSFLECVRNRDIEFLDSPDFGVCDYPSKNMPELEKKQNLEIAKHFLDSLSNIDDEEVYSQTAKKIWYLMPSDNLDLLIPLMESGNMYVEQDISDIFVFHNYRNAIPALREAAKNGSIYIQDSAKIALKKMRDSFKRTEYA